MKTAAYLLLFGLLIPIVDLHYVVWLFQLDPLLALPLVLWANAAGMMAVAGIDGVEIHRQGPAAVIALAGRALIYPYIGLQYWAIVSMTGI